MNILFVTRNKVTPNLGGTEMVTRVLAKSLSRVYGHMCYSAYLEEQNYEDTSFVKSLKLNRVKLKKQILSFIEENAIDVVICQGEFRLAISIKKAVSNNCKVIAVHHFAPGWEEKFVTFTGIKSKLLSNRKQDRELGIRQLILFPYLKYVSYRNPVYYRKAYEVLDNICLLSSTFIGEYMKYAGIECKSKFFVIPNPTSFEEYLRNSEWNNKDKVALVVGRMEEVQKNITAILKIWNKVKKSPFSTGWSLRIVGDGPSLEDYKRYALKNSVPDVQFLGRMCPQDEYKKAMLFLMTSNYEGRPLTLTEAQQFGCIPVVWNSFSSVYEIINDGIDGIIIPNGDMDAFVKSLLRLMSNEKLVRELSYNAVNKAKLYSINRVTELWNNWLVTGQ